MAHNFGADKHAPAAEYGLLTRVGVTTTEPLLVDLPRLSFTWTSYNTPGVVTSHLEQ